MKYPTEAYVIVMVLALVAIGVIVTSAKTKSPTETVIAETRYIQRRYIDVDAGVVCYLYHQGIDCLPISETKLGQ